MTAPLSLPSVPLDDRPVELPRPGVGWIFLYVAVQIACNLALIVPALSPARVVARSLSFGVSLLALMLVPGSPFTRHPVRKWLGGVVVVLLLSALNPEGDEPAAILVHAAFYVAVFAPVFWVARLNCSAKSLGYVLVAIWLYSTASAVVGVLQAYYPGRFLPSAGFYAEYGPKNVAKLMIRLANGTTIPRPPGLTDVPGGAVGGSFYAVLLGIGVGLLRPFPFARLAALLSAVAGMTCIYLCQFRSALVMLGICVLAVIGLFALAGRGSRSALIGLAVTTCVLIGFVIAFELGGASVTARLKTLTAEAPGTVYYTSRGVMVEDAFVELLPQYPFGAGLGRWGMVAYYFGSRTRTLWAEVQWAGWVLDGGFLMVILYPVAIFSAIAHSVRLALRQTNHDLEVWATVIAGYNIGALALTFSYALFMSSAGVEFWLINAALIQAAAHFAATSRDPALTAPAPAPA